MHFGWHAGDEPEGLFWEKPRKETVERGFRAPKGKKNKKPRFEEKNIEKKHVKAFLNNNHF